MKQEPAFPYTTKNSSLSADYPAFGVGMSKRFYAACAAMQGLMNNPMIDRFNDDSFKELIGYAYKFADELLKQENNEENS